VRVHMAAPKIILVIALAILLPSMASAAAPNWASRALAMEKAQDWQGLLDYSFQETEARPGNSLGWYFLGVAYENLGRFQEAVDVYLESVRLWPENEYAWYNLGTTYNRMGQYREAADAMGEAVRLKKAKKAKGR